MTEKRYCLECGKEIIGRIASAKFCSEYCRQIHNNRNCQNKKKLEKGRKYCEICGKEITFEHRRRTMCEECSSKIKQEEEKRRKKDKYCAYCGKHIEEPRINQKYCCKECLEKAEKERERNKRKNSYVKDGERLVQNETEARKLGLSYGEYMSVKEGYQTLKYFMKLKKEKK